jgi:transposase
MSRALPAALDLNSLPNEVAPLQELVIALAKQLKSLQQQFLNLRRLHFAAKSEQLNALQADLFAERVSLPVPPTVTATVSYERIACKGRRLPKDLPRTRIDYELSESERAEFDKVERIGEEISETLDYTPAKLIVVEHARGKYRCEKAGEATIRVAQAEPSPIPKANASAGLLAQVLVAKYADGLPVLPENSSRASCQSGRQFWITRLIVRSGGEGRRVPPPRSPYPGLADAPSADSVRPSIRKGVFANRGNSPDIEQ